MSPELLDALPHSIPQTNPTLGDTLSNKTPTNLDEFDNAQHFECFFQSSGVGIEPQATH